MTDREENLIPWGFELEEYIRLEEPDKAARADAWQTAIGLQAVDGLRPSQYLLDTAKKHIEGDITIDEVQDLISGYYQENSKRSSSELEHEEADIVASRITKLLNDGSFTFSPAYLKSIHKNLFKDLIKHAGAYRDFNMSKREWILKGETVRYGSWDAIKETLEYDFSLEEAFSYHGLSADDTIRHIAKFTSGIWQIHPFPEGNTRTTAVFIIKYVNSLGYSVNNEPFAKNSWYFRNALARANYTDMAASISSDSQYLEAFFENLLYGASHKLKNRYMHLDWKTEQVTEQVTGRKNMLFSRENDKVTEQVTDQVKKLLLELGDNELSAAELMARLKIKHRPTFMSNYLWPALDAGLIELTVPDKPNSRLQKYRKKKMDTTEETIESQAA